MALDLCLPSSRILLEEALKYVTSLLCSVTSACLLLTAQVSADVQQQITQRAAAEKQLEQLDAFIRANVPKTEADIKNLGSEKAQALVARLRALAAPVVQAHAKGLYNPAALKGKLVQLSDKFPNIKLNAAISIRQLTPAEKAQGPAGRSVPIGSNLDLAGAGVQPLSVSGVDADLDGLDDGFEAELADAFKFNYKVSNNEQSGTGFATFQPWQPQTVKQVYGPTPTRLHYRVAPLGYTIGSDGRYYNLVQVDYLSLWNRDDGLVTGTGCTVAYGIFFGLAGVAASYVLDGLESHALDNERTAHLLASPTDTIGSYSTNINDWRGIAAYTAAHEGTSTDSSAIITFGGQVGDAMPYWPILNISQSKSKHASYAYNPGGKTLVPSWVQAAALTAISYITDYWYYLSAMGAYQTTCYACITEKFDDPGSAHSPSFFVNVGEPNMPINDSVWIRDGGSIGLYPKLNGYILWPVQ